MRFQVRALGSLASAALALAPTIALAAGNPPRPEWHPGPPAAPLFPGSAEMRQISDLFWIMLVLSAIVFIGVAGTVVLSAIRYSAKPGDPEPRQVYGNRSIEILWTAIPAVILAIAFGVTVKYMTDINSAHGQTTFDVNVIGHQWWWEFQYPQYKIDTADELHVPTGVTIHYHITSADVVHAFWIPQLQRQIDANPGLDNAVFAKFDTPGIFDGTCYEFCGIAHAWMKFRTIVQSPAQFSAWRKHMQQPAAEPVTGPSATAHDKILAAGKKIFLSNTCVTCHAINGTPAGGAVGPNLTHFGSRWTIGAGAAPNTVPALEQWIYDPNTFKPGVNMPSYSTLSKADIHAIAEYLTSLK